MGHATSVPGDLVARGRIWSRREKLIERAKYGTVCRYGELEEIMGSEIPALPALEMPHALEDGEEGVENATEGPCEVRRG